MHSVVQYTTSVGVDAYDEIVTNIESHDALLERCRAHSGTATAAHRPTRRGLWGDHGQTAQMLLYPLRSGSPASAWVVFTPVTVTVRADLATARSAEVPVPYLTCPRCTATVYSAARWSSVDYCPRCGTALRGHDRLLKKAASFKRALSDVRRRRAPQDPEGR
jgi:hypothetical protein